MMFALILFGALVGTALGNTCTLSLQNDTDASLEPLFLVQNNKELDFVWPESLAYQDGVLYLDEGEELELYCTGKSNKQASSGEQSAALTCTDGVLLVAGKKVSTSTISCTKSFAQSTPKLTTTTCGNDDNTGEIVQLGFELEDGTFHVLVEICQNSEKAVNYYAMHQLYGASVKGKIRASERRSFSTQPKAIYPVVNPDKVYVRSGQIKAFNAILGSGGADLYINSTSYLARGHLAPHADFIYNSGQLLSYYYANVAPQWQNFNAGNWLSVESITRAIATKYWTTINVITGTYGILELANAKGTKEKIYLDATNKILPAPEYFWKILHNPESDACVVAVGTNNPFLKTAPTPICDTVIPNGFPDLTKNLAKGYTYYCDYASFKTVVNYVPELTCTSIFEF